MFLRTMCPHLSLILAVKLQLLSGGMGGGVHVGDNHVCHGAGMLPHMQQEH